MAAGIRMSELDPLEPVGLPRDASPNGDLKSSVRILIVDDDRTLREGCASVLQVDGYNVTIAGRGDEALSLVRRRQFDIILVDLFMADISGLDITAAALVASREVIVILMTGNPTVASSLEALRAGAWDYLPKPFSGTQLQVLIGRAAHGVLAARESQAPAPRKVTGSRPAAARPRDGFELLGNSAAFRRAVDTALRVAPTKVSVMITGESGTGKELIAQLLHRNSPRSANALVPVNCAAMPEGLFESELFGHRKGAFTGADRDKRGLLEVAHEGTLFLDELTDMPLAVQAKLLRVIQDGVLRRVGSEQRDAVVDVRVISATNRDPLQATADGSLREDLFYRLRVVPIHLSPLRERTEDIPLLAEHFLTVYWERHREAHESLPSLSGTALEMLRAQPWTGNVRELQNVIEHLAVIAAPGRAIRPEDIPLNPVLVTASPMRSRMAEVTEMAYHEAKELLLAEFEQEYLKRLMTRSGDNMSKAARLARIDRTTLYRLYEKHSGRRGSDAETRADEIEVARDGLDAGVRIPPGFEPSLGRPSVLADRGLNSVIQAD
ncbi:MAG: sigma-54 dependent transcriptional regulator [Gemmatimonadaceae bacterium]